MDGLIVILTLLAAVVASSAIARAAAPLFPVPLPFAQIGLGALIGLVFKLPVAIEPELFLLLFIAPLLFLDGWRIPRDGLLEDKWTILALAMGLVVFTVLGAGYFIHWLIPAMPLAVAFALAAILSPTDAVAVGAIAKRTPFPRRLLHILEGEALLNDASGLVCMRFAVVAALTGTFSLLDASASFLWLALAGTAIGVAVTVAANGAKDWIARHFGEETGTQILISLLIPFGAYLLASRLEASGILAAVAAGIAMNQEEKSGRASSVTRIRRAAVWDAVQFAGNGVIFVLLGHQLRAIAVGAAHAVGETGHDGLPWLLGYVLAIIAALVVLRGLWVWISIHLFRRHPDVWIYGGRLTATAALAGARGAVTLSGVMTLPLSLNDGTAFPARDLAIFLAAGVIVASLLLANVTLPSLAKGLMPAQPKPPDRTAENAARLAAAQAALRALEAKLRQISEMPGDTKLYVQGSARIIEQYRRQAEVHAKPNEETTLADDIERSLRLIGLRAERDEYFRIARAGGVPDELARALVREIDLTEARLAIR